jgi:hypothetical protein
MQSSKDLGCVRLRDALKCIGMGTVYGELVVQFRSSQKRKLAHAKMILHENVAMLCERMCLVL